VYDRNQITAFKKIEINYNIFFCTLKLKNVWRGEKQGISDAEENRALQGEKPWYRMTYFMNSTD